MACERPDQVGRSLAKWDCTELARELVSSRVLERISADTVRRILANHRLKPWRHHLGLLKESFGQLWDYRSPRGAWRFYCQWRNALRWQRLEPFARFARMIAGPWDGIAASCHNENKVPLGFVEGLNNKIRVLQRRAYGLRDEEYLRLMILTCMLPKL